MTGQVPTYILSQDQGALAQSLLLGTESNFIGFGTLIRFTKYQDNNANSTSTPGILGSLTNSVKSLGRKVFANPAFNLLNQTYAHVFVHEMGHVMANKCFTGEDAHEVQIYINTVGGKTIPRRAANTLWKRSVVYAAGPMADLAFNACQLAALNALENYIPWPVIVVLGTGAVTCTLGEMADAVGSLVTQNKGDFAQILRNGTSHLIVAGTVFAAEAAAVGALAAEILF